ncbi:uncharacterized protein LOC128266110 isoform X3 [Drosophila gunungcola]|uniref:Uncharacterized protein n=3 Tax=Drosophila gunungcola TaxID=103775 RepID=A0A9P9YVR3_9MUSC|nr:uncharacterized protein LOC128266110 isoform X3 [Drosophila gunungcola]XP_052858346.1 uncharacterized protein LOC128266110 isoform X3 [Drosophila gunungcola]XP_052858347.1 uncharacterized protein LOC128266110 isoform X3 [Drosophila gunungcola]XP_052858348.1 uncharacterized protein LOC128266110 isoform X3 [Drosophila gunungcola]XP_052858349.1 uncharacterized protein LOC128266110 isoform X3 [Drosophila gunungcola]KAI8043991.1 hypothetical protein M5D96_000139 [Drosophila gunungcola]
MLQLCTIYACANGTLGLNLSRAPWDPYPWVSGVQAKSNAEMGGVRLGDTLLELNGADVLGLRISELASRLQDHWQSGAEVVTLMMWRQQANMAPNEDPAEASHAVQHGINQQSLQKFATCLQHISQLLECPVCLEVIKPPGWQCCNGHVLCNNCRSRSVKCPVCRVPLGPRGRCLLSDKLFTLLAESFPCDGGKANKVTAAQGHEKLSSSVNKCTNEYHNQPKMALAKTSSGKKCGKQISRQLTVSVDQSPNQNQNPNSNTNPSQMPKGAGVEANAQAQTPTEIRRKSQEAVLQRCTLIKVQHQETRTAEELGLGLGLSGEGHNNMLVKPKLKLSKKSWRITGPDQDGLRCDEVATINNVEQVRQQQQQQQQQQQHLQQQQQQQEKEQYQNYHCPTGKSCSLSHSHSQAVANKLSTESAGADLGGASLSAGSHKQAPASGVNQALDAGSIGRREWQLLRHLSAEHRLAVVQIYGTFGERFHVRPQLPQEGVACLRLSGPESFTSGHVTVHTFFLAVIAISGGGGGGGGDEHAIFLWHQDLPHGPTFETVIETQCGRILWQGPVQSLRRSWPEIRASGQFLTCRSLAANFEVTINSR